MSSVLFQGFSYGIYIAVYALFLLKCRFHHQRVPLVILVCGTACTGKSTIATQLAQRLNLPNVLQVYCLFPSYVPYLWAMFAAIVTLTSIPDYNM
jgi:hypothetical protein